MCGFNQPEWFFLVWIVVVSNQILVSFYKKKSRIQSETKFFLGIVISNHKNVHFWTSFRIQTEESLPFRDLNFPNK